MKRTFTLYRRGSGGYNPSRRIESIESKNDKDIGKYTREREREPITRKKKKNDTLLKERKGWLIYSN